MSWQALLDDTLTKNDLIKKAIIYLSDSKDVLACSPNLNPSDMEMELFFEILSFRLIIEVGQSIFFDEITYTTTRIGPRHFAGMGSDGGATAYLHEGHVMILAYSGDKEKISQIESIASDLFRKGFEDNN
jgi:hypothetical protein